MDADSPEQGNDPTADRFHGGFIVRKAEVYVGEGGIAGGAINDLPPVRLACNQCGYTEERVPVSQIRRLQRQHEASAHPDVFQKRRELQRALAELDRRLWEH